MGRNRIHESAAARSRAFRARRRLELAGKLPDRPPLGDDARAVVEWAASKLRVPPGHPRAGRPFNLDPWQVAIIDDVLTHREVLACVARKNAKSDLIAVVALSYLRGPLRAAGWRCGVLSASRQKAGELLQQLIEVRDASGLQGLTVRRTPWPGKLIADDTGGRVEIEGAGYASGHAAGYDLAIVDEIGLLQERHRAMVAGMRSAGGAKDGKFLAISIHGNGPFVGEILARRGAPGLAIHHYHGDPDLALDDPENWRQANPGLGTIKSLASMRDEAARVLETPSDQAFFRAHDLNLPGSPVGELIAAPDTWRRCELSEPELPPRSGACVVGLDLGFHKSFTSAACYWPASGRLECLTAAPDTPGLAARARSDAAGELYERCGTGTGR